MSRRLMKRLTLSAWVLALALAVSAQTGELAAFADAPYSEAKDFVELLAAGGFGRAADMVAEDARASYPPETLERGWMGLLERYGPYRDREVTGADLSGDQWIIHVLCTFDQGKVDMAIGFSSLQNQKRVRSVRYTPVKGNERR